MEIFDKFTVQHSPVFVRVINNTWIKNIIKTEAVKVPRTNFSGKKSYEASFYFTSNFENNYFIFTTLLSS